MLFLLGCNENASSPDKELTKSDKYSKAFDVKKIENSNYDQIVITDALEEAAVAFSKTLKNKEIRMKLKEEIGKKFDGDYEVLYKTVKDNKFSDNNSFGKIFATGYKENKNSLGNNLSDEQAESELSAIISQIPKFQIAMPVNFEKWDAEKDIPLVTFRPCMKNSLIKKAKAIDEKGNVQWLDAKNKPDVPVIVLGWNERTDENGNLHKNSSTKSNAARLTGLKKENLTGTWYLRCSMFKLGPSTGAWQGWPSWVDGDPEFYIDSWYSLNSPAHYGYNSRTWFYECTQQGIDYRDFNPVKNLITRTTLLYYDDYSHTHSHLHLREDDGGFLGGSDDCGEFTHRFQSWDDTWVHLGIPGEYYVAGLIARWVYE